MMTVRARVKNDNVIFCIKILIVHTELFQILYMTPIPIKQQQHYIQLTPTTSWIATDLQREHFTLFTESDVNKCLQITEKHYICNVSPVYNMQSQQALCEMQMLRRQFSNIYTECHFRTVQQHSRWAQLKASNHWIYLTDEPSTYDLICDNNVSIINIEGPGILTLENQCKMRNKEYSLIAVNHQRDELNLSFITTKIPTMHLPAINLNITTFNETTKRGTNDPDV